MLPYQHPGYRPAVPARPVVHARPALAAANHNLGTIQAMNVGDWLLLAGGGIVGGAGVNGLVGQLNGKGKVNAVGVAIDLILVAVGGTLFVQKMGKLLY